jgi:ATP-binding cassette subfamily B protein
MGWFDGLDAESYDRTYTDRELLGRIWPYFMRQGPRLFVAMILVMLMAGAGAGEPMVVGYGLDWVDEDGRLRASVFLVVGIFAIGLAWWFLRWLNRRTMARLVGGVVRDMQTDAFGAAIGHDLAFYDQTESGKVVSRITSDTQEFSQLVDQVTQVLYQLVEIVMLLFVLLSIDVGLTLWLLSVIPVVLAFAMLFRFVARNLTRKGMRAIADVNASVKESVAGIAVTKNFRQEGSVYEEFAAINRRSYGANLWRGLIMNMVFPILTGIGGIGIGLVVYQGGISVLRGAVMVGQWYLFLQSLDRIMYPMMQLSSFWTQIQTGLAAAERIFALIDAEPTVVQTGDLPVPEVRGSIQFEHVHFRYREEEPVLADFSLHIQPGETVAFVGHTGAGKSSLARLIARFYEFQAGRILLDGQDLRELDLVAYRRHLGIVPQTPFLFSGTILENIRYGRPDATREEIEDVANGIGTGEWLRALPRGLDSDVGERGALLSMGQRQLVALVRVLVRQPRIFLLDEATASVDPFTERQIQEAIELILRQTTSILIAHRLSTVRAADRILVLDHGQILEEGNHEQLMGAGGHYAELYDTYFRHQSLEYVETIRDRLHR